MKRDQYAQYVVQIRPSVNVMERLARRMLLGSFVRAVNVENALEGKPEGHQFAIAASQKRILTTPMKLGEEKGCPVVTLEDQVEPRVAQRHLSRRVGRRRYERTEIEKSKGIREAWSSERTGSMY